MSVAQVLDHVDQALGRLLQQDVGRPNTTALVTALGGMVQAVENLAYPVLDGRLLQNAVGAQLDGIGQIVGQARDGATDDVYRLLLVGRIHANTTDSTTNALVGLAMTLFGATSAQVFAAFSPGHDTHARPCVLGLEVGSPTLPESLYQVAVDVFKDSLAAVVRLSYVTVFDQQASFALDGPIPGAGLDGASATLGMATQIYLDAGA